MLNLRAAVNKIAPRSSATPGTFPRGKPITLNVTTSPQVVQVRPRGPDAGTAWITLESLGDPEAANTFYFHCDQPGTPSPPDASSNDWALFARETDNFELLPTQTDIYFVGTAAFQVRLYISE